MQVKLKSKKNAQPKGKSKLIMGRRRFLKTTGLGLGAAVAASTLPGNFVRKAHAGEASPYPDSQNIKTVCNYCSVGCGIIAEVKDGVWERQEMDLTHPISRGGLCSKGAASREITMSERRLKTPVKLVDGKWQKISWDTALGEIADNLKKIRKDSGPDSVFWMGSAKFNNEQAYMFRKMAALWGTNNVDHQARV